MNKIKREKLMEDVLENLFLHEISFKELIEYYYMNYARLPVDISFHTEVIDYFGKRTLIQFSVTGDVMNRDKKLGCFLPVEEKRELSVNLIITLFIAVIVGYGLYVFW